MRRVLLTALAAIMGLSLLAGCDESAGAQVHLGDSVKIGVNLELSGRYAGLGDQSLKGAQLAVTQINDAGGVLGKPIGLVVLDNLSDGGKAVALSTTLMTKEKVLAVLGPASNPLFTYTNTVAARQEIAQVTVAGCAQATILDTEGAVYPYSFRPCAGELAMGSAMANFASQNLAASQALVLKVADAVYATDHASGFTTAFTEAGGQVVGTEDFAAGEGDFTRFVAAAETADVVFISGPPVEGGLIINTLRAAGVSVPVIGTNLFDSTALVEAAGAETLNDVYYPVRYSQHDTSNPKAAAFAEAFRAAYEGAEPTIDAALAYDSMLLIADAIQRAAEPTGVAVRDALASSSAVAGASGSLSMGPGHEPLNDTLVIKLADGAPAELIHVAP